MERAQSIALGRRLKLKWVLDASKLTCVNNNFVIGINTNVMHVWKIFYRGYEISDTVIIKLSSGYV